MERMERIENLNVRGFCAQGTVRVGGIIPMSIALFRPVACLPIISDGFPLRTTSFYR
jgi:hypothetical protein